VLICFIGIRFGTFATGGGDGIVSIWDSAAKKRLRQLPKYPGSITSLAFNSDGSKLAIGCSILEEENPANNPAVEDEHSNEKGAAKDASATDEPDTKKKNNSHFNSLKNCVFVRNVVDDCKVSFPPPFLLFSGYYFTDKLFCVLLCYLAFHIFQLFYYFNHIFMFILKIASSKVSKI
jgi:WD40 repeat protein